MATIATFPGYVKILGDGFSSAREPLTQRSEMESGPVKQLQTKSRGMIRFSVRIGIEKLADYRAFTAWFRDVIGSGRDWFWWDDPLSGKLREVRFVNGLEKEETVTPGTLVNFVITATMEAWDI